MTNNNIISNLPKHLQAFVIDQSYSRYSPHDQVVWRYVMHLNTKYLAGKAHPSYFKGLEKTGISIEHIPSIDEMNEALGKLGWAAATVDGFIPPSVFMEFQAHNVLVIAADIRPINQIGYTPAPDIIHEAAGHAPIIADPVYAEYLRCFGEIGAKAFSSATDHAMYQAIRHLSILKTDPNSPKNNIAQAEELLSTISNEKGISSEMALIRNLHWWTVEYGLIGTMKAPKIYGAGLLSSLAESKDALSDKVFKIPYSLDAINYDFDITKPQPQLFITPDFEYLTSILNSFAAQMALQTGGLEAILKAIHSGNTATLEYNSGLQISGTFTDVLIHNKQAVYLNTTGPTTLNYQDNLLEGHSKNYHKNGFGSPIGNLKNCLKPVTMLTDSELNNLKIEKGRHCKLEFESDVALEGTLLHLLRCNGKIILMSFADCSVKHLGKTLFEPSWGTYDMAIGEKISSAFSGPADPESFGLEYTAPKEKTHKIQYSDKTKQLNTLCNKVNRYRTKTPKDGEIANLWETFIDGNFHNEWLLPVDLYILLKSKTNYKQLFQEIEDYLIHLKKQNTYRQLIEDGMAV